MLMVSEIVTMTLTSETIQEAGRLARFELARRSFDHFLPYVRVIEPGKAERGVTEQR